MGVVLVVGGAGYLGSVLTGELLELGYAVRVLDRLYYGEQGLAPVRDRVELVVGDMRDLPDGVLDGVEAVINVGGLSNDPTAEFNPRANYEMNTIASASLARRCRSAGVARYLLASSCSVYDRGVDDESRDVILDEASEISPFGAYAGSKVAAEQEILPMGSESFCVSALRKATLFGFSPRMRYDLVVNTFVKDALSKGHISLHYGGEMWRPLADVRDAARAYIALLRADADAVNGKVLNLVYRNFRISEVALRVREALRALGHPVEIRSDYAHTGVRNYRVNGERLSRATGFVPRVTIESSVEEMVHNIRARGYDDFENPVYYNINWMRLLERAHSVIQVTGSVFEAPARASVAEFPAIAKAS